MSQFKQVQNSIFTYLNIRFGAGQWSPTSVAKFYNNLSYSEAVQETKSLNSFLGSSIPTLPTKEAVESNKKLSFTILNIINKAYKHMNPELGQDKEFLDNLGHSTKVILQDDAIIFDPPRSNNNVRFFYDEE